MTKGKPKRQPDAKPLRIKERALKAMRDDGVVDYAVPASDLRQAIFVTPPLMSTAGEEDDPHQIQVSGVLAALRIAKIAGDAGRVYEIPVLDAEKDGGRTLEHCRKWLARESDLPFSQFAFLACVGPEGGNTRSFVVVVDDDGDADSFKFSAAKAFRTANGRVGWSSSLAGTVNRRSERAEYQVFCGEDIQHERFLIGVLFHMFALAEDGSIAPQHVIDVKRLN